MVINIKKYFKKTIKNTCICDQIVYNKNCLFHQKNRRVAQVNQHPETTLTTTTERSD